MNKDQLSALIAQAEFHKFLKMEVVEVVGSGEVTLKLPYSDDYSIFKKAGNYHGGIIASLIDVAGTMACSVVQGAPTPTANLRIDYLMSPSRCDLIAKGQARRIGKNMGVADVTICGEDGTIFALGRGTFKTTSRPSGSSDT